MNITVTFTDTGTGGTNPPDGSVLAFENVADYELSSPVDLEDIDCAAAACEGCNAVHRRVLGTAHLRLEASGPRSGLRWVIPGAVS